MWSVQIHHQPVKEATLEQLDVSEGGCHSLGIPRYAPYHVRKRKLHYRRFAGKICDPMGDLHRSSLFLKGCILCNGPTLEKFMKKCSMWEGLFLEKFVQDCLSGRDPTMPQGQKQEEGATETW